MAATETPYFSTKSHVLSASQAFAHLVRSTVPPHTQTVCSSPWPQHGFQWVTFSCLDRPKTFSILKTVSVLQHTSSWSCIFSILKYFAGFYCSRVRQWPSIQSPGRLGCAGRIPRMLLLWPSEKFHIFGQKCKVREMDQKGGSLHTGTAWAT